MIVCCLAKCLAQRAGRRGKRAFRHRARVGGGGQHAASAAACGAGQRVRAAPSRRAAATLRAGAYTSGAHACHAPRQHARDSFERARCTGTNLATCVSGDHAHILHTHVLSHPPVHCVHDSPRVAMCPGHGGAAASAVQGRGARRVSPRHLPVPQPTCRGGWTTGSLYLRRSASVRACVTRLQS